MPTGGVNDHMLLRLFASLQLTQLLLLYGGRRSDASSSNDAALGDAASFTPFAVDADSIDFMDVDASGSNEPGMETGDEETDELWRCWKTLRRAASLSPEVGRAFD